MDHNVISRRDLLKCAAMGAGALSLPGGVAFGAHSGECAEGKCSDKCPQEVTLQISGADKEFSFIHWTDVHLSECDSRDKKLVEAMAKRAKIFGGDPTRVARDMVRKFNDLKPELVAVTGDYLDAPTKANIEIGAKILKSIDAPTYIALGNHEWGTPSTPWDRDYWRPRLRPLTAQPLDWHVQQMHGVNFLFVDDSNYQITADQLKKTQELLKDNRSCILFMHIPVATDSVTKRTVRKWKTPILLGAEGISKNKRKSWHMGETIEPSTAEFCRLVKSHPQIKAIFAGHIHLDHESQYQQECTQYVTGPGYAKGYRHVRIVPEIKGEKV
jgi:3',5'-cyclic AMP phosphodiesterase CpdA